MVGADPPTFERIEPYLRCFATDVLHCGPVGCGQVVKLMNDMVLFEIGAAIAEALAIGRASGVDPEVLVAALSKGSADSFALRNHARNTMVPRSYPERAFSTRYALKDLEHTLALAEQAGIDAAGAGRRRAAGAALPLATPVAATDLAFGAGGSGAAAAR